MAQDLVRFRHRKMKPRVQCKLHVSYADLKAAAVHITAVLDGMSFRRNASKPNTSLATIKRQLAYALATDLYFQAGPAFALKRPPIPRNAPGADSATVAATVGDAPATRQSTNSTGSEITGRLVIALCTLTGGVSIEQLKENIQ